jgi:hypothetical protein
MGMTFLVVGLGMPAAILAVAVLGALLSDGSDAELLDWRPTRSAERELELEISDVDEMLAAHNRYRRMRGEPERSLEDVISHPWAGLESQELPGLESWELAGLRDGAGDRVGEPA